MGAIERTTAAVTQASFYPPTTVRERAKDGEKATGAGATERAQSARGALAPAHVTPLPLEVEQEMAVAANRFDELRALGRELHFLIDEKTGRVVVEVRDLEGRLVRRVPPSTALGIATAPDLGIGPPGVR
jgi:hypothetical protein